MLSMLNSYRHCFNKWSVRLAVDPFIFTGLIIEYIMILLVRYCALLQRLLYFQERSWTEKVSTEGCDRFDSHEGTSSSHSKGVQINRVILGGTLRLQIL